MDTPTATELHAWSQIDFGALGYGSDDKLQVLIDRATALVENITGQTLPGIAPSIVPMVQQAIQMATELLAYQAQPDVVETAADFMLIASFTAGSYSESRRSLTEINTARGAFTPNPLLNNLLFGLMTPDQRDFWWAWMQNTNLPSFAVTEVDWAGGGLVPHDPYLPAAGADGYLDVWGN